MVLLAVLLLSCTAPLKTVTRQYEDAPLCCKSFRDFDYEKIEAGDRKKFRIDGDSRAFLFDTGKSFFMAFELPEYRRPYSITIKSFFIGDRIQTSYIFSPEVIFLDEDFKVARKIDGRAFRYVKPFFGPARNLKVEIPVTDEDQPDKYMIILTTKNLLERKTGIVVPIIIPLIFPGLVGAVPMGSDYVQVPHSPVGKIKIELKPLTAG